MLKSSYKDIYNINITKESLDDMEDKLNIIHVRYCWNEELDYINNKLYIEIFKNSTLFYNSNVPVTSKVHYTYSVPLVDKVSQTANISDEQDQLIIDLATQCAVMEMYLM